MKKVLLFNTELPESCQLSSIAIDYDFINCSSYANVIELSKDVDVVAIFIDIDNIKDDELDIINHIKINTINCEVVVFSNSENIEKAKNAFRLGAFLYFLKPISTIDIKIVLDRINSTTSKNNHYLDSNTELIKELFCNNDRMKRIVTHIEKVATTNSNVLFSGPKGTGKEIFARYLHMKSFRNTGPFFTFDCTTASDDVIKRELVSLKLSGRSHPGFLHRGASIESRFLVGILSITHFGMLFKGQGKILR